MTKQYTAPVLASYLLTFIAGIVVLKAGLLLALFAGLLVYSLVHMLAPAIESRIRFMRAHVLVVVFLSLIVIGCITGLTLAAIAFARSDAGSLHVLLQRLAGMIEASRVQFPAWVADYLPSGDEALRGLMSDWLHRHGQLAQVIGEEAGHSLIHLIMGMVIGGMIALHDKVGPLPPFPRALLERAINLQTAFQRIVFAQVRISAINATLSAIYLLVALPASGVQLPFSKTMVVFTFVAGLLPVVGNIISNSVIVVVSLATSLQIAVCSLAYLVVIHKLEYFLNARIIGSQINARAWELLIAILVMEALFGIPGLVAAPVFYALLKMELGIGCQRLGRP